MVTNKPKTKVALSISGAISLGSYQAGVIYEFFDIMKRLGDKADFEIDVITGASAGSVNSIIFALAMIYDERLIEFAKRIWLEGLDISALLEQTDNPWDSLFSNKIIRELKKDLLEAVVQSSAPPKSYFPDKVKVGLTLTNLSGIPYNVTFNNKDENYQLTTFADWYIVELRKGDKSPETIKEIDRMIDMAIASGAFPFAFPAQKLQRKWKDYDQTSIPPPESGKTGDMDFIYVDGGLFNNEPVNRARELANKLDTNQTKRIYLLVDPTPPESLMPFAKLDMFSIGQRLIPAILAEAHFRDWHQAVKTNTRLNWQKKFLNKMGSRISPQGFTGADPFRESITELADEIAEFKSKKAGMEKNDYLGINLARIREHLKREDVLGFRGEGEADDAVARFAFVLENIANLRGKKTLDLRLISPEERGVLAGDFLGSFGGFFALAYREHDFNIGRSVAREFIGKPDPKGLGVDLSPLMASLEPTPYNQSLNEVDLKDAPEDQKERLRDSLIKRADALLMVFLEKHPLGFWKRAGMILAALSPVGFIRWAIRSWLTRYLNKLLAIKK